MKLSALPHSAHSLAVPKLPPSRYRTEPAVPFPRVLADLEPRLFSPEFLEQLPPPVRPGTVALSRQLHLAFQDGPHYLCPRDLKHIPGSTRALWQALARRQLTQLQSSCQALQLHLTAVPRLWQVRCPVLPASNLLSHPLLAEYLERSLAPLLGPHLDFYVPSQHCLFVSPAWCRRSESFIAQTTSYIDAAYATAAASPEPGAALCTTRLVLRNGFPFAPGWDHPQRPLS